MTKTLTEFPIRPSRILLFTVLIFGQYCKLIAQPTFNWDKTFGGESYEELNGMITVSDGIVVSGSSKSNIAFGNPADYTWNILVVKFDFSGNEVWRRYYGGNGDDRMWNMIATSDGGFLVGGFSYSGISGNKTEANRGDKDVWILRLDAQGMLLWDKTYGALFQDELFSILEKPGGTGFFLGCHSNSEAGNEKTDNSRGGQDYWIIETDANGNKLWDTTIGGSNYEQIHDLEWAADGNILISGGTNSNPNSGEIGSEMAQGSLDFILYKINPVTKSILWMHRYGGTGGDFPYALHVSSNGNIYMGGGSNSTPVATPNGKTTPFNGGSSDFWLIELDPAGTKLREWDFGGTGLDELYFLSENVMGQLVMGGVSDSDISGNKITAALGGYDMWIIGLDMFGQKNWETTVGGTDHDALTRIANLPNGEWIIGGHSQSNASFNKTENSFGGNDFWLLTSLCNFENTIQATIPPPCSGSPNVLNAPMNGCTNCGYTWSSGSTTANTTLPSGTSDTIRLLTFNTYGCFDKDSIIIKPDSLVPNISSLTPLCAPNLQTYSVEVASNAGVLVSTAGSIAPMGVNTYLISNIPTGTNIVITATNTTTLCTKTLDVLSPLCPCTTVTPPLNPINSVSCEGSMIPPLIVTPNAGTTIYWFGSATGGTSLGITNEFTPNGTFPAGVYTFYAEAQDNITNCPSTPRVPVILERLAQPEIVDESPICAANLLTYSVSLTTNSLNIQSSTGIVTNNGGGNFTISNIPTGSDLMIAAMHPVTGCTSQSNISSPVCPCPAVSPPTNPNNPSICPDQVLPALSVATNVGSTVVWYNSPSGGTSIGTGSSFTPTGITGSGTFTFYAEALDNINDCPSATRTPVTLTIHAFPAPALNLGDISICEGEPTPTLSVSSDLGTSVRWFNTATGGGSLENGVTFTPGGSFSMGVYTFYAESQNIITGCKSEMRTPVNLTIHALPSLTYETPVCAPNLQSYSVIASSNNGNILSSNGVVSSTGSDSFLISEIPLGSNIILTAVNPMNCQVSQLLASPLCPCPIIAPPTNAMNPIICDGEPIPTLSVSSEVGTSVFWFDAALDGTLLGTGFYFNPPANLPIGVYTYYVEAMDDLTSCTSESRLPITLTIKGQTLGTINGNTQLCIGSTSVLSAGGGTNIQWSSGQTSAAISITPSQTGTYTAIIGSAGYCPDTVSIVVMVGQSIEITKESFTCDPSLVGTTSQSYMTASGCDSTITVITTLSNPVEVTTLAPLQYGDYTISCTGASDGLVESTVTGGVLPYIYSWSNGATSTSLPNINAGIYSLTVTDERGCTGTDDVEVNEPDPLSFDLNFGIAKCGDEFSLLALNIQGGSPPFFTLIDGIDASEQPYKLEEGQHAIAVWDAQGCRIDTVFTSIIPNPPTVFLPKDTLITLGQILEIEAMVSDPTIQSAQWTPLPDLNCPGCFLQTWQPLVSTKYTVKVTDSNGCTGTAIMLVRVSRDINLYIPNVFSPNDDGLNDHWILSAGDNTIRLREVAIFDRWGNQAYSWNNDIAANDWLGWNGETRGKAAHQNVYTYYLKIAVADGEIMVLSGSLTIVR